MYYKLPIKDRMDLMKSYKKTNKDMSYSDMVNDYNTSYQRFKNGGINDDDKNKNLTSEDNKQFLKNMSNSPLFAERYSKMTGSNNPLEVSKYKEDLNTNLNSVKLVDNDLLLKYRKADAAYNPSYHTIYEKKEKDENRYPLNNLHELSHSSTKGELVFKNPYTYNPTEEYYKNEEMKKYLTQPTETKARVDVGRKLLLENGQYDPINERFTEDGYEKLKLFGENNQNIQDLIKNYSKEDVIRMFNDITYNKKNNNQLPIAKYGGIQRFDNGGKMPKKEINLNIKNQEFNSPVSTWNENLDWQGEKYNDVGLNFNKNNLNIGIGNYVPRSTFEKTGNINPYLNVSYDLNDRNSIGGNFSKDYNGVSFIRKFDNGGKLSYPQKIQAYNDSTILFNSGFGRGIPNQIYNPQFNAAKKRLTELNKKEPQSTDYYRSYANHPEYLKTHSIPYAKPTYPKKDTVLPEKKEKTRTDIYTNKELFDKAYKAETDSSNAYTHYKNDTKGWVPANTVKNENKVKDFVKNNQTLKDAYYNKTEDAITYFPIKPKKPVVHNVYQPPPPPEKMIPIEARVPKDIVEPGLKTSPKDFGYRRIGWRSDPNTHLQVPVLLTHPKMKIKQGERIYNNEIPTSTMGIPKDWEAEFSKPEETKKTDNSWRKEYGGIQRFDNGGIKKEIRPTADNTNVAQPIIINTHNKYNSEKDYQSHLLDPYTVQKRNAQIEWLDRYKVVNKDKVGNYEESSIPINYFSGFDNEGKDTVIDLNKNNLSYSRVGEMVKGNTILGGDFLWDKPTAYYATDYKKHPQTFKNPGHPTGLDNTTKDYYGIENKKLKIGKINDFNDSTVVTPAAGNFSYNNAFTKANESKNALKNAINGTDNYVYLKDQNNKDINLKTGKGKFIVHSPKTGAQEFVYGDSPLSLANKINDFKKRNPDAKLLQIDNGRFHRYLSNPDGLTKEDYENYAAVTTKTKPGLGYNLIATPKK